MKGLICWLFGHTVNHRGDVKYLENSIPNFVITCCRCGKIIDYVTIPFEHYTERSNESLVLNYPKGSKVIVKSNKDYESFKVKVVVDYVEITKSKQLSILWKDCKTGEETINIGAPFKKWSKKREAALKKLTPAEQWNVLTEWCHEL